MRRAMVRAVTGWSPVIITVHARAVAIGDGLRHLVARWVLDAGEAKQGDPVFQRMRVIGQGPGRQFAPAQGHHTQAFPGKPVSVGLPPVISRSRALQ